jgi:hypothetical protein
VSVFEFVMAGAKAPAIIYQLKQLNRLALYTIKVTFVSPALPSRFNTSAAASAWVILPAGRDNRRVDVVNTVFG